MLTHSLLFSDEILNLLPTAFEFNVQLQDHVKRLRNEREAQKIASAPAPPPRDLTLKGSMNICLPGGATAKPKATAAAVPSAGGGLSALLPPPPGGASASGRARRPVASGVPAPAAAPTTVSAAAPAAAHVSDDMSAVAAGAPAPVDFGADPFGGMSAFGGAPSGVPAAVEFGADPFGASSTFGGEVSPPPSVRIGYLPLTP